MCIVKPDGPPQLCKTDEIGEIVINSRAGGTMYYGLPGVTKNTFEVCQRAMFNVVGTGIIDPVFLLHLHPSANLIPPLHAAYYLTQHGLQLTTRWSHRHHFPKRSHRVYFYCLSSLSLQYYPKCIFLYINQCPLDILDNLF